jgi:hypothetical protein
MFNLKSDDKIHKIEGFVFALSNFMSNTEAAHEKTHKDTDNFLVTGSEAIKLNTKI